MSVAQIFQVDRPRTDYRQPGDANRQSDGVPPGPAGTGGKINRAVGTSLAGAILWLVPLAGGVPLKVMAAVMWQKQTVSPHCRPEAAKEGRRQDVQRLRVCRRFTSSHDRLRLTATTFNLSNGCRESALIRCHLCQWNLTPPPKKKTPPRRISREISCGEALPVPFCA